MDSPAPATLSGHAVQTSPRGRTLLLSSETLIALEERAGRQVATEEDVLVLMDRLSSVKLGGIHLPWNPAALAELKYHAQKRGKTPELLLREIIRKLSPEILTHLSLV